MLYSAARNAQTSTLKRPNSHFTSAWHNIEEPPPQDKTQQSICILRIKVTLSRMPMFTFWTERTDGLKEE